MRQHKNSHTQKHRYLCSSSSSSSESPKLVLQRLGCHSTEAEGSSLLSTHAKERLGKQVVNLFPRHPPSPAPSRVNWQQKAPSWPVDAALAARYRLLGQKEPCLQIGLLLLLLPRHPLHVKWWRKGWATDPLSGPPPAPEFLQSRHRSEERRVGKECRL